MNSCADEQLALSAARERRIRRVLERGNPSAQVLSSMAKDLLLMLDERDRVLSIQSAFLEARCAACAQEITPEMRARDLDDAVLICADSGRIWCEGCASLAPQCAQCGNVHDLVATPDPARSTAAETTS